MGSTKIEWTHCTWNPGVRGCEVAGPECRSCYAAKMSHRLSAQGVYPAGITQKGPKGTGAQWTGLVLIATAEEVRASAEKNLPKRPHPDGGKWRVFVNSMSDLFHADVPFWFIDVVFEEMAARPHIDHQVLTKRAERMAAYDADRAARRLSWPANVWAGVTCGTQKGANERILHLLRVRAGVRFLSMEPLLGRVDLDQPTCPYCGGFGDNIKTANDGATPWCVECNNEAGYGAWLDPCASATQQGINWVICGGESGSRARPTHPTWVRSIRDQCVSAGVAFHFKQWGHFVPSEVRAHPNGLQILPSGEIVGAGDGKDGNYDAKTEERGAIWMGKADKHAAGRILDGRTWDEFPEVPHD